MEPLPDETLGAEWLQPCPPAYRSLSQGKKDIVPRDGRASIDAALPVTAARRACAPGGRRGEPSPGSTPCAPRRSVRPPPDGSGMRVAPSTVETYCKREETIVMWYGGRRERATVLCYRCSLTWISTHVIRTTIIVRTCLLLRKMFSALSAVPDYMCTWMFGQVERLVVSCAYYTVNTPPPRNNQSHLNRKTHVLLLL